jgi:branched-chain amino acid transport system substrate-binding protein
MGTSGVPAAIAMAQVGRDAKTPMIGLTPILLDPNENPWVMTVAQPTQLMIDAVVERMKRNNVKTVGYIGFTDAWGDLVYDALMKAAPGAGIKVVSNERYARADASVTGQVLKIVALRPDAVMTGGAGTPGALPFLALQERGFKGGVYGQHGLINPDFVRVVGASGQNALMPTGPVIVAEQLPDSYPTKKIATEFRAVFQKVNNAPTSDAFSAYSFDGWLVFADAASRAMKKAEPGTRRVPRRIARCHLQHQGSGGHARRLHLQARQPLRRGRTRPRDRQAGQRPMEARTLINAPLPTKTRKKMKKDESNA